MQRFQRLTVLALLLLALWAAGAPPTAAQGSADFPLPDGHFYSQANGLGGGAGQPGFAVADADGIPFWTAYLQGGGVAAFGYPISGRFASGHFTDQAMQKAILQWDGSAVTLLNVLDVLHAAGMDALLQARYLTPPPADTADDSGLAWPQIVARHQGYLDGNTALRAAYFSVPDPISLYGLPVSAPTPEAGGTVVVVRCQRAVLQQWLTAQPWAAAGQVTVANAGDIAKVAGLVPAVAATPQPDPYPSAITANENWSGYVVATDLNTPSDGAVGDVRGRWTVPSLDCQATPDGRAGIWVGIDGVFNQSVEQTGIAAECRGGSPAYYGWFQTVPEMATAQRLDLAVQAGDAIAAEVAAGGDAQFTLTLRNLTSGAAATTTVAASGRRDSAEWVVEVPNDQPTLLAKFSPVVFSDAAVSLNGRTGAIAALGWATATMSIVDQNDQPRARPSPLTGRGTGFRVTWLRP